MMNTAPPWQLSAAILLLCVLAMLAGCATPTPPLAPSPPPQWRPAPVPSVVQSTLPKPAGYFQRSLADYSNASPEKPTK